MMYLARGCRRRERSDAPLASLGLCTQAVPLESCQLLDQICFSHEEEGRFLED